MPGSGLDISANDREVMVVGTDRFLYRFNKATQEWAKTTGGDSLDLAVGKDGTAWYINKKWQVLKQANN